MGVDTQEVGSSFQLASEGLDENCKTEAWPGTHMGYAITDGDTAHGAVSTSHPFFLF